MNAFIWSGGGGGFFDLIYLSAVDYAIPQKEMIDLLADQKALLRKNGSCIMISESFLKESSSAIQKGKDVVKVGIKHILEKLGFYHRGQFWGWQRTQLEYQELMIKAGYSDVQDGFIETRTKRLYFIEGHKSSK